MKKIFISFFLFSIWSYAIDLSIAPDTNISITNQDTQNIQQYYKKYFNIVISDKGAKKIAKENRALANAYIQKKHGVPKNTKNFITIATEFILADQMIKDIQNQINISPKILHTYYLDNIEKFKKSDRVKLTSFLFPSPEDAITFYIENKTTNSLSKLIEAAKQYHVKTIRDYQETEVTYLDSFLRSNIKTDKSKYLLPPRLSKNYEVFFVVEYHPSKGYRSFDEVKEEIKKDLHKKRYLQDRKKLLSTVLGE